MSEEDPSLRKDPLNSVFPKVAKCTFNKFGPSGTIEKFDGLCILSLNIINEKVTISTPSSTNKFPIFSDLRSALVLVCLPLHCLSHSAYLEDIIHNIEKNKRVHPQEADS